MSAQVVCSVQMHTVAYTVPCHNEEELHENRQHRTKCVDEGFIVESAKELRSCWHLDSTGGASERRECRSGVGMLALCNDRGDELGAEKSSCS